MVDERALLEEIITKSQEVPVLIDFWAPWCQPCKTLGPVLEKLEKEAGGAWALYKINVDENQALAMQFGIQSIPNVKLLHEGRLVQELTGAVPENEVRQWLEKHLPKPPMSELDFAKQLIQEGEYEKGAKVLERILLKEPDNEEVRVLKAKTLVFDKPDDTKKLLEPIKADSKFYDSASALISLADLLATNPKELPESPVKEYYADATRALKARKFESALDSFFEVLIRDRNYQDDGARKGFIAIFNFLGRDHKISKAYARRFEMIIFS